MSSSGRPERCSRMMYAARGLLLGHRRLGGLVSCALAEQPREESAPRRWLVGLGTQGDCILASVPSGRPWARGSPSGSSTGSGTTAFARRSSSGSSAGRGVWAVGRAINPCNAPCRTPGRTTTSSRATSWATRSRRPTARSYDDLAVSAEEGVDEPVRDFAEDELLKPLERWFFGHPRPTAALRAAR